MFDNAVGLILKPTSERKQNIANEGTPHIVHTWNCTILGIIVLPN